MLVRINDIARLDFSTRDPETAASADAVINSISVYENSSLTPMAGTDVSTIKLAGTGQYTALVTCDETGGLFTVGNHYSIRVNATVGTYTDEISVGRFEVSAGSHGKVVGSGVPEIGVGQPGGLPFLGTNTAIAFESDTGVAFRVASTSSWGMEITSSVADGLYLTSSDAGSFGLFIRGLGAAGAVGILSTSGAVTITGPVAFDPSAIWSFTDTISNSKTAFEALIMAAAGAGAGVVDVGVPWDAADNRQETVSYLDGTEAYIVDADVNGNRQSVNLNPP